MLTYHDAAADRAGAHRRRAVVNLVASTSGTDSDWVVKLIDVYPDEVPSQPEMGGYQLAVAMDIFRGRYRESFETPKAIAPNKPLPYRFALPTANHVFLPGHRIMVQVQSSWFPLYDRNPQTFVANIFFAKPADYVQGDAAGLPRGGRGELHRAAGRRRGSSRLLRVRLKPDATAVRRRWVPQQVGGALLEIRRARCCPAAVVATPPSRVLTEPRPLAHDPVSLRHGVVPKIPRPRRP